MLLACLRLSRPRIPMHTPSQTGPTRPLPQIKDRPCLERERLTAQTRVPPPPHTQSHQPETAPRRGASDTLDGAPLFKNDYGGRNNHARLHSSTFSLLSFLLHYANVVQAIVADPRFCSHITRNEYDTTRSRQCPRRMTQRCCFSSWFWRY